MMKIYNTLYLGKWKGATSFKRFRDIKGEDYEFINICSEDPETLALIEKEMEAHNLLFAKLPDLCGGDGNTQYVVARSDMHIFAAFLMDHNHGELQNIKEKVKPHQILLVVDALTGQDAVNAAKGFNEKLDVDGIIMTKMDGDARGGAALSARKVTGKPILFLGTGEKYNALEAFHPDRMASRILGMGDLLSLIENAERDYDEAKAEKQLERLKKNQFTLEDFLEQMGEVKRMGGIGKILEMMPGVSSRQMQNVNLDESEKEFRQYEAIIYSMTKEERQDPSILNASRRKRIAAGCGLPVSRINTLIKRYEETKKMLKQFSRPGAMKKNRMLRGLF